MKFLTAIFLVTFSAFSLAVPNVNKGQIVGLISQTMRDTPLMWMPFPIPYEIAIHRKDKDALLLEALLRHKLVSREEFVRTGEYEQGGRMLKSATAMWRYDYEPVRAMTDKDDNDGFYYGYGRLIRLQSISEPTMTNEEYYLEVKVEWAVADLQAWVKDPAFKTARTLRRSVESETKPFEQTIYLRYDGDKWHIWKADGEEDY